MEKRKLVMVLTVISLAVAIGFHPSPAIGEKKYVTFLGLVDFTGPIAGIAVSSNQGIADHFTYVNKQGGIDGVEINPILVDTRYDTSRAVSAFKRYRQEHKLVLVFITSTGVGRAMYPLTFRDKVPIQVPGVGYFQHLLGWAVTYGPLYQDLLGGALDWIVEDWKSKGNPGMPIVGYMGWDNAMGRENMLGGKEYAAKLGVKLLDPEYYPVGSLKHDIWLTRLRDKGAKYIYISGTDPEVSNVVRDGYALGISKDVQLISECFGTSEETGVSAHPEEFEGEVIFAPVIRGVETDTNKWGQLWKQLGRSKPPVMWAYLHGVGISMVFEAALKVALKDVGYEKVNGEALYNALQKITGLETDGIMGPVDLSPTSRRMTRDAKFYRVSNGKIVPITPWRELPDTVSLHKWD